MPECGPFPSPRGIEPNAPDLAVCIDVVGGTVELAGHLGRGTAYLLHDAVTTLLQTDGPAWQLDVRGLTGCDGTGLRVIGAAYRRALRHSRRLAVVGASRSLQRELSRLRLDRHVFPSGEVAPVTTARRSA